MAPRAPLVAPATSLSVTRVNELIRQVVAEALPDLWVAGEISGFRKPVSGHFYFTLKDERSQLACVMFKTATRQLRFLPEDGMQVVVRGRIGIYEARGALQLYVDALEPHGVGAQQLALEQLKRRLAAEGLFAEERKRALPVLPQAVGIATALHGAAIHDILTILQSRFPGIRSIVRPVRVQGRDAGIDIAAAIEELSSCPDVEVIIIGRGGGSTEDLWAFNDELVARAIASSHVPVISAVGHEIDFTIADLVADRRAATPTAAAAMAVPEKSALVERIEQLRAAAAFAIHRTIEHDRKRLNLCVHQLRDPRQVLRNLQQRVDELSDRAWRATSSQLRFRRQSIANCQGRLTALSPLAVLQRGYCIAQTTDGHIVSNSAVLQVDETLRLRFATGTAQVKVLEAPTSNPRNGVNP